MSNIVAYPSVLISKYPGSGRLSPFSSLLCCFACSATVCWSAPTGSLFGLSLRPLATWVISLVSLEWPVVELVLAALSSCGLLCWFVRVVKTRMFSQREHFMHSIGFMRLQLVQVHCSMDAIVPIFRTELRAAIIVENMTTKKKTLPFKMSFCQIHVYYDSFLMRLAALSTTTIATTPAAECIHACTSGQWKHVLYCEESAVPGVRWTVPFRMRSPYYWDW